MHDSDEAQEETEFSGYMQKKSSRDHVAAASKSSDSDGSYYDIKDITGLERPGNRVVVLHFSSNKFLVTLKAISEEQLNLFFEIVQAKRSLYCINELLLELGSGVTFRTVTFSTLMVLSEREQSEWIVDRLNDSFEVAAVPSRTSSRRANPVDLVESARRAVDDFVATCQDCAIELESRNPKLMAHCRKYMHRYSELLKARLALELSYLANPNDSHCLIEMGERALCALIALMERVEALSAFRFLARDFLKTLTSSLFSVGELISALLNIAIERVEAWFQTVVALPACQRSARLVTIQHVLIESLTRVDFGAENSDLQLTLMKKITMSVLLNFSDQLSTLDLSDYDEGSLLQHIVACGRIREELPTPFEIVIKSFVGAGLSNQALHNRIILEQASSTSVGLDIDNPVDGTKDQQEDTDTNPFVSRDSNNGDAELMRIVDVRVKMDVSEAVAESIRLACHASATQAATVAVINAGNAMKDILALLLHEGKGEVSDGARGGGGVIGLLSSRGDKATGTGGWIGGSICNSYVTRLSEWLRIFSREVPAEYVALIADETGRLVVRLYMQNLIHHYQKDKRMKLSRKGVHQLNDDLCIIYTWMKGSLTAHSAMDEKNLVLAVTAWINASPSEIVRCYAAALQLFGIKYATHVYDLLRLVLKLRIDLTSRVRKNSLGLCGEFLTQIEAAVVTSDPSLIGGMQISHKKQVRKNVSIFDELCPRVGVEHCTGKKWGVEMVAANSNNLPAIKLEISNIVAETCTSAREQRANRIALHQQLQGDKVEGVEGEKVEVDASQLENAAPSVSVPEDLAPALVSEVSVEPCRVSSAEFTLSEIASSLPADSVCAIAVVDAQEHGRDKQLDREEWLVRFSTLHNRTFWKNSVTGEKTWKDPHKAAAVAEGTEDSVTPRQPQPSIHQKNQDKVLEEQNPSHVYVPASAIDATDSPVVVRVNNAVPSTTNPDLARTSIRMPSTNPFDESWVDETGEAHVPVTDLLRLQPDPPKPPSKPPKPPKPVKPVILPSNVRLR